MANPCYNKVIIGHDDLIKVKDLYHITSGDFFEFIKPRPLELCIRENSKDSQYLLDEYGADNLYDWIMKNWDSRRPYPETLERTLSRDGSFLSLQFDTAWTPPIGIYKELERQGFHLRAYFFSPYSWFCGSFIYGVGDWYNILSNHQDIPQDIDRMFGVYGWRKGYDLEEGSEYPDKSVDHEDQEVDLEHTSSLKIDKEDFGAILLSIAN